MNLNDFRALARRKSYVKWTQSGLVERLRLTKRGVVMAQNLVKEHPIFPFPGQTEFFCTEIDPKTPTPVWSLLGK